MKNIEFYYDKLMEAPSFYHFCLKQGMDNSLYDGDYYNVIKWLNEEHQILDETEKRYLSAVIKPLKTKGTTVKKEGNGETEWIIIKGLKSKLECDRYIIFPSFKTRTMYKGMEINKAYTLEELGV